MTTKVTIKHTEGTHHDVLVETFDPQSDRAGTLTRVLKLGEELELYVYASQGIRVLETEKGE